MILWSLILCVFALTIDQTLGIGEILYALNAGGEAYTDSYGIRYKRDYLTEGQASDYGKMLDIQRVTNQDKVLYQTERYATETFGYTIPIPSSDGDYVLWLKFAEVWFNAAGLKVFDVTLNDVIISKDLDIFAQVGRGSAHDESVGFQVRQNKIIIQGKSYPFNNEIRVEFIKTDRDNPKINAIIVMRGTVDDVPPLLPPKVQNKYDEFEDDDEEREIENEDGDEIDQDEIRMRRQAQQERAQREQQEPERVTKKKNSPKHIEEKVYDPYESDNNSYVLPVLIAIGAFIPFVYCLCKI